VRLRPAALPAALGLFRQKGCVVLADAFAPDLIRQFAAKLPKYTMVKFTGSIQNLQADPAPCSSLAENPYQSIRVDPDSGSAL
jgi:hypothetical protein